jgi:hypothetical protein
VGPRSLRSRIEPIKEVARTMRSHPTLILSGFIARDLTRLESSQSRTSSTNSSEEAVFVCSLLARPLRLMAVSRGVG